MITLEQAPNRQFWEEMTGYLNNDRSKETMSPNPPTIVRQAVAPVSVHSSYSWVYLEWSDGSISRYWQESSSRWKRMGATHPVDVAPPGLNWVNVD